MTDPTTDNPAEQPEGAQQPPASAETDPAATEPTDEGEPTGDKQARRDAKIREQRDALRSERDTLAAQVSAMRWAEVYRRSSDRLASPEDLALVVDDSDVDGLWTEDGSLDTDALAALLDSVTEAHPSWRKRQPSLDTVSKSNTPTAQRSASWSGVLKGRP